MLLAVDGLCKRFGGFLAVNQVSFEVRAGEILGLIGPNGSGKSTTFNLIAGNLRPNSGSIRFDGEEIGGLPAHAICHLGVGRTFQIPRPFRKLSLIENVTLAAYYGEAGKISRAEAARRAGRGRWSWWACRSIHPRTPMDWGRLRSRSSSLRARLQPSRGSCSPMKAS